jgi:chromosome partitioning protein
MFIAIASLKGGVGKTTTAIHLAAYFQELEPTLLIDADRNRSALVWSKEEKLPFYVASQAGAPALIKRFTHLITDMKARPEEEELKDLAEGSDLVIIPTTPNHLDLDATLKAIEILEPLKINYKILLTKVDSRTKTGKLAHKFLAEHRLPLFKSEIPLLVAFERASQHGVTVKHYHDFRSRQAWTKYQAVGDEIVKTMLNQDYQPTAAKG